MARQPRVWFPGAIYHITARGNRRASLFYDDEDRLRYLELLEEARFEFPFILHAYCLMTNHIHLLLETTKTPPGPIMKKWHSLYAIEFNRRHHLVGHVFQGRYAAEIIATSDYLLEVSRYIHRNPLEANMVSKPENYRWSSYRSYISNQDNHHISTSKILSYFSEPEKEHYRRFVEEKTRSDADGRNSEEHWIERS
ncbi:transposase [Bacillus tianshenii]|nr:transposase [Bacillus tianshenii]